VSLAEYLSGNNGGGGAPQVREPPEAKHADQVDDEALFDLRRQLRIPYATAGRPAAPRERAGADQGHHRYRARLTLCKPTNNPTHAG
jgi:hypothetical protein